MYSQVERQKENKSEAAAKSVTQKKGDTKKMGDFIDKRHGTAALKGLQLTMNPNTVVIQQKRAIGIRKRLNKEVTKAIRLIQAGGPPGNNATQAEVQAHDRAMNPGQHHQMRVVRRAELIAELQQRKSDHANNNIRDDALMNTASRNGQAQQTAQL